MTRRREVRYRDDARSDLDNIFWFIVTSVGSPEVAMRYVQRIESRCQRLADAPFSGRSRDDLLPGMRTIAFERSALICYLVIDDTVWITNVFRRGRDVDASFAESGPEPDGA